VTDRLPSDHDAVTSYRTRCDRVGRTTRVRIPLPAGLDVAEDDVIRLSLEGDAFHSQVDQSLDGDLDVRGSFDNARLARTGDGENHLQSWADDVGLTAGDTVVVDVVTPGFKFGLRRPGERVVYEATEAPSSSLSHIARDLDG
jgi:hypothetical protein